MAATMASWSQRIQLSPHGQLRNLMVMTMMTMMIDDDNDDDDDDDYDIDHL